MAYRFGVCLPGMAKTPFGGGPKWWTRKVPWMERFWRVFSPRQGSDFGGRRSRRAFTLVELLIALALSVLIGGILYLVQSTGLSQVGKGTTRLTLQSEMRRKLERLVQDLRCANEVLEIGPGMIKVSQFKTSGEADSGATINMQTISYFVEKDDNRYVLKRMENQQTQEIFSADHIEGDVFIPFYEEPPNKDHDTPLFKKFDLKTNDSGWRKAITFIRIRMKARQKKEFITLITSTSLRMAQQRLIQPNWKLR